VGRKQGQISQAEYEKAKGLLSGKRCTVPYSAKRKKFEAADFSPVQSQPQSDARLRNIMRWNFGGQGEFKIVPRPPLGLGHNRPPCDSMTERLIGNPMPVP